MSNHVAKAGLTLAAMAAICTALVATTYQLTAERIAANEQAWLEQSLTPALSGVFFEGSVTESMLVLDPPSRAAGQRRRRSSTAYTERVSQSPRCSS